MRIFILVAVIGAALAAEPLPGGNPSRIVGGDPTTIEQYPYLSNVQYLNMGIVWAQFCGGSLLTSRTILSAAHCYYYRPYLSTWRIRLGSTFQSSGGTLHDVSRIVMHEEYVPTTLNNDVAIVWLATPATLSPSVAVARIAGPNYHLADGTAVTALGWGHLAVIGSRPAEQLQRVDVNIINQQLCAERYAHLKTLPTFENWPEVTPAMMCAGILDVGGRGTCTGDHGGPLIHQRDVVVGITSWGRGCADHFYPGVNTRVSYLSDWIVANGSTLRPNPSTWRVRLGSSYASSGGTLHQVTRIVPHERYVHAALNNDVAIVWIVTPATLSPSVAVARIAGPNYHLADGTVVTAVGWGYLGAVNSFPAEQLQHVDVNIINQQLCVERNAYLKTQPNFEHWPDMTPAMLCAGILDVGGRDACQGDSGGPLVHQRDIVVGVTSWGYSCAHHFYPGVNARVSYLADWIVANAST